MEQTKKKFEDSLKSIETENFLDRVFYRPIGYRIALLLSRTSVTPNVITIISIFIGVFAGMLLYPQHIWINLFGFVLLVFANILDCVDGQLARLTGIKSKVGRILDGLAGDFWFISIYLSIALRVSGEIDESWIVWLAVSLAGASNFIQAGITDYYKTAHLYFISQKKGEEFDTVERVKAKHAAMPKGINRFLYRLYIYYTTVQIWVTPQLQKMLKRISSKYGEDFPEDIRLLLRKTSLKVMPYLNITTFNGRSIALLVAVLTQNFWIYLLFEIICLNLLLLLAIKKYERYCKKIEI